ncbi:hypothetical protein [Raineyella sp. LH-20]|uniref:hypothetical protein n=1 Tax=Raineyella sp. LH-20 TaxID=3081204 RepID=UPI0029530259|nr:hypothetical protein [Raineyella sp. LH-20]WOP17892.1 hypothetical protein R0146_11650 [Raineyella sp. LH-20]
MNTGTPPLRTVGHALWLGPMLALLAPIGLAIGAAAAHPLHLDDVQEAGTLLVIAVVFAPVWLPPVIAASVVAGLAASAVSALAAWPTGGRRPDRVSPTVAGTVAAGLVALVGAAVLVGGAVHGTFVPAVLGWGVGTGGATVLVTGRARRTSRGLPTGGPATASRRRAAWWGLAAVEVGAITWSAAAWLWVRHTDYAAAESCATALGISSERVVVSETIFPPQRWCLSGDIARPLLPLWWGPALVAGLTLTALCLVLAWHWWRPVPEGLLIPDGLPGPDGRLVSADRAGRRATYATTIVAVATVLAGATAGFAAAFPHPPTEAVQRGRIAAERVPEPLPTYARQQVPAAISPTPPSPTPVATVSAAAVTARLTALMTAAQRAGGADLRWPRPLAISTSACTDSAGTTGRSVALTGRFTTRDPASATDNVDFLSITQANEAVAEQIVDAWSAQGLTAAPEPLHGEWYSGPPEGKLFTARVGFDDGVGDLQVTGACATAD